MNRFFAVPFFAVLGTALPWDGWRELGWNGVMLAVAVLLFRRLPVLFLLRPLLSEVRSVKDALFIGWFGPVAVAAVYYASLAEKKTHDPLVWHVVSLVVVASVLVHGATAAWFSRRYSRS